MNDVPNSSVPLPPVPSGSITASLGSKEMEHPTSVSTPETGLTAVGKEIDLPKEVTDVGVRVHSETISLLPAVEALGVKGVGEHVPVQTQSKFTVPLTDEQIAQGVKQGVSSSWRWLAVWCKRRLLQLHAKVQSKVSKT